MKFGSIEQIEKWLIPYSQAASKQAGSNITTERTRQVADLVGNPQSSIRVIHVAGTSGKTTTSYYAAAILTTTGRKIGLTISPHIDSLTERVQLNGQPLSDKLFCEYFSEYSEIIEQLDPLPTYFEILMVFSLWVFEREKVDYAVIETGLGGFNDSSNIVTRSDKVCILTDIGLDHQHVLGKSLPEIAKQKIGIAWPGNTVVSYQQSPVVMRTFSDHCYDVGANLLLANQRPARTFLDRNWQLAYQAVEYISKRDHLKLDISKIEMTKQLVIVGRLDIENIDKKIVIFDGAHNEQKMSALLSALDTLYPKKSIASLVAFKKSKDYKAPLKMLIDASDHVVLTEFTFYQDTQLLALPATKLAEGYENQSEKVVIETNTNLAWKILQSHVADIYVVAGSFYLIAQLRRELNISHKK